MYFFKVLNQIAIVSVHTYTMYYYYIFYIIIIITPPYYYFLTLDGIISYNLN